MRTGKIKFLKDVITLFDFKSVSDGYNEYILSASCEIENVCACVEDKTAFEALNNHIHLLSRIKKRQRGEIYELSEKLGKLLISVLHSQFPDKHFVVFVTVDSEVTVRFHQKWSDEPWYYITDDENAYQSKVFCFDC